MKRPLAYITAAWCGSDHENTKLAAQYCRTVYEVGFSPICPTLYQPLFLNDAVPEEHKSGIDMGRDLLRRSHVLVVCGHSVRHSAFLEKGVMQEVRWHLMIENNWILCPICRNKTRIKIRGDTVLENFPLYCPKCKQENLIRAYQLNIIVIKEPDAQTQSR